MESRRLVPYVIIGETLAAASALSVLFAASSYVSGIQQLVLVVFIQAVLTYSVHCPAHYFTGTLLGIKFKRLVLGGSALRNSDYPLLRSIGRFLPTLGLVVDRSSMSSVPLRRAKLMFYSGVASSTALPLLVAAVELVKRSEETASVALLFALGYLVFNLVFSPRTGDVHRARLLSHSHERGGQLRHD